MTDEPERDDDDRARNNIAVALAAAVLIALGVIVMLALSHALHVQDCVAASHKNCVPVDTGQ